MADDPWAEFKPEPAPKAAADDPWAEFNPESAPSSIVSDVAKSAGTGVLKGVYGLAGLPGDVASLFPESWRDAPEKRLPTTADITSTAEKVTGKLHEPQTTAGKFAQTVGEFAPAAIGGPETLIPRIARRVIAPGLATEAAGQAAEAYTPELAPTVRAATALATGMRWRSPKGEYLPRDVIEDAAASHYQHPDVKGLVVEPGAMSNLRSSIERDLNQVTRQRLAPNTYGTIEELEKPLYPALGPNAQGAVTIDDIDSVRKILNRQRMNFSSPGEERLAANIAVQKIDDFLANLKQPDLRSGNAASGVSHLQDARADWAAAKRMEMVDDKIQSAVLRAASTYSGHNVENAIRQNLRAILNPKDKKLRAGWTDEELDRVRQIVEGGGWSNFLREVGNRTAGNLPLWLSVGEAAISGHPGLMAIPLAGRALKTVTNRAAEERAAGLGQLLSERSPEGKLFRATRPLPREVTDPGFTRADRPLQAGVAAGQLQYTPEGYPYVQSAQARRAGGRVHAASFTRGRPLGEKAFAAVRKARERSGKTLSDGRAQKFQQAGAVKPKSHERFAGMLTGSPSAGGIFPSREGQPKPKAPTPLSEADIARQLRSVGISGEAAGGFAGQEFGPQVEQYQRGGAVKVSKHSVNYSKGMKDSHCGICRFYDDHVCQKVRGYIGSGMWCKKFQKAPQRFQEGGEVNADSRDEDKAPPNAAIGMPTVPPPIVPPRPTSDEKTIPRFIAEEAIPHLITGAAESAQRFFTGPGRAYRGEMSPEEQEQWGREAAQTMAMPARVPPGGTVVGSGARLAARVPGQMQKGIASVNLRQMPIEEALPIVRSERHIIPKGEEGEGFVGAPLSVKTRADLDAMRTNFDAQVEEGMAGAPWYQTAQQGIREMAGASPEKQHMLAREKALFSAQSTPDVNLGYTLQAHNAFNAGRPRPLVRTGQQARTYNEARAAGEDIPLGAKTDVYAGHLDPTLEDPITGTNDIWHARAFGYARKNGKPWDGALTAQQHAFMDAETMLAVDRANARGLGGRTDWTAGEIQASPWVARKTQGLMEQFGWPYAKAREEAIKTYNAFFDKYTAYGTHEATPGVGTRHLPGVAEGPLAERAAFAEMPASTWANPEGRDVMYEAAGMYQRPIQPATGVFQGPKGMEINPAAVSRPMVSMSGKAGERVMDPASRALMTGAEGARAYVDAQNMGAFSMPIFNQKIGQMTSVHLPTTQPLTVEQIGALRAAGAKIGLPEVIDYGRGAMLTSFGEMPKGVDLSRAIKPGSPAAMELESIAGVPPKQAKLETGAVGYEKALAGPQGTGMATRVLQKALRSKDAPALMARLDGDLALRTKVMERLNRDAEYGARTGQPVRADVQRARRIIARDGFAGLFRALRAGVALPAAVLAPVMAAMQQPQEASPGE